jgi:hypothetical protein
VELYALDELYAVVRLERSVAALAEAGHTVDG